MTQKIFKLLLLVQGIYILLTALWGIIDIDSFMMVTGPKTDIWLVKTVSVILVAIALCFLTAVLSKEYTLAVIILGIFTCSGLAIIDFYYTLRGTISKIYMLDGVAEVIFLMAWLYILVNRRKGKAGNDSNQIKSKNKK